MRKNQMNATLGILALCLPLVGQAADVPVRARMQSLDFYKNSFEVLFKESETRRVDSLAKALEALSSQDKARAMKFIQDTEGFLPKKILLPLVYWRFVKNSAANTALVLTYYGANRINTVRDYAEDPLTSAAGKKAAQQALNRMLNSSYASDAKAFASLDDSTLVARLKGSSFWSGKLRDEVPGITEYSLTWLGFIPGNKVELVNDNKQDLDRIQWFNDRIMFAGGKLDFSQPYMKMPLSPTDEGHIAFKEDPMFQKIRDMVISAKESIFIDIFLFGGTMGGTLAKFLLDQTLEKKKANPNFKVLLLHDFATNYNMKDEMMPVFDYIRDRIEEPEFRDVVYLLQANIQRHPPGIPFGITNLIPKTDETFKVIEQRNTYYESKIDHSKVIVVDANGDAPQAYFGSKNWTDHSGGYYYDNAIYVKGPAAAVVQYCYYDDVDAALTTDPQERKWFFFKEQGYSNDAYLPKKKEILEWFRIKRDSYPAVGDQVVRITEANVDGKIKDARNILIDMISKAQKHIYMEQLFIYDTYVNDALIKRKKQVPGLVVKILADHNGNFAMGGLPNTIFLKKLMDHGIEVKARRTYGIKAKFPNGKTQEYHQENHRKITSVDGKVLLGGSSNLNPDTLQGSFREFGAQIYDKKEIAKFENYFMKDWSDNERTGPFAEKEPLQLKLSGKELSPGLSQLLNDLAGTLIRAKDDLEKR